MPNLPAASAQPVSPGLAPPPLFSCTRRAESPSSIRLILAGELDLSACEHFAQAMKDAQLDAGRVVLDLQALTLIDCAALAVLFEGAAAACRDDAVLIMLEPRAQVRRVLDLIGPPVGVAVLERSDGDHLTAAA